MNAIATPSPRSRHAIRLPLLLLAVALLAACGEDQTAQQAPQAAAPAAAAEAAPAVDSADALRALRDRANAAIKAQRLFAPAGDNAFELFQQVVQQDPSDPRAAAALVDLQPYAVMEIEGSIARGELAEARRVLDVLEKVDATAPALPRLRNALANARPAPAPAAAQPAVATTQPAARTPAAAAASAPPPVATPTATAAIPPPQPAAAAPAQTVAAAAPAPVEPPAPEPQPAAPAPVAESTASTGALPAVVNQVTPRYPPMATRRKLEGWVEVEFTIQPDGSVGAAKVIASEPEGVFDREAVAAMERWRFAPPGKSMSSSRVFDFKLRR